MLEQHIEPRLVVRLEPVEVVVVLPLAPLPAEADLLHLGRDDGEVRLHVPVQEVGHHHAIGHHMDHDVLDAGEKLGLTKILEDIWSK